MPPPYTYPGPTLPYGALHLTSSNPALPPAPMGWGTTGQIRGTTNYFLNGMPIAGANLQPALDAIAARNAGTPTSPTGPIGTTGFNFNTGALQNVPPSTGLPDYAQMLDWLTQGQQNQMTSPQGPIWP